MSSIWTQEVSIPPRDSLKGTIRADVAVIGGGMAGMLTAYFLHKQGVHVVVLEADRIGSGQTKHTTAKITAQHGLIYHRLRTQLGEEAAAQYARANQAAISQYESIIHYESIDCQFEKLPSFVYSLDDVGRLEQEVHAAQEVGLDAELVTQTALPFSVQGAVRLDEQAQFHPLAFLKGISKELTVYENTMVKAIEEQVLRTAQGEVQAEHIVMATHFPFLNAPGYYFMRMHQDRSYVLALEHAADVRGMYIDADENGFSFRNSGKYLLLGGGGHRTGENSGDGRYLKLRKAARDWYPDCTEAAHWSAQDCMTLDGISYIGAYSASTPHLLVATGFNKWGMSSSMAAAQILTAQILGHEHPDAPVFSPQRFHLSASAQSLVTDGMQAVKGLSRSFLKLPDTTLRRLPKGHGGIVDYEGEKVGVYKNEDGEVFVVSCRCPHLGCQLEWNPDELSWDCPCHGSRFDYRGKLLDNPAMEDLPRA